MGEGFGQYKRFSIPYAEKPVPVTGVWLFKEGDEFVVCVEVDGVWRRLFSEHKEGPVSHIMEPAGIRKAPRLDL